jgi:hypothetical protein
VSFGFRSARHGASCFKNRSTSADRSPDHRAPIQFGLDPDRRSHASRGRDDHTEPDRDSFIDISLAPNNSWMLSRVSAATKLRQVAAALGLLRLKLLEVATLRDRS